MSDVVQVLETYFKASQHPVVLAYVFGSLARDATTPLSDVDVAVLLDEPDPGRRRAAYLGVLVDLVERLRPRDVDLLLLGDAAEPLASRAILEGVLVYSSDEQRRVCAEEDAIRAVLDRADLDAVRSRYLRRRVLEHRMGQGGADMIDRRVVHERLDFIDGMLGQLKRYRSLTLEEFTRDRQTCHAALYELQTTLEAVADIGNHLIAALALRRPLDRGDIPAILAEGAIIPAELAERLRRALGMRNIIVHGYLRVALAIVHPVIRDDLGDIEEFCRCIVAYLGNHD